MLVPFVHDDPAQAAALLPDTHNVKLPTEALQLLGNFFHARGIALPNLPTPSHGKHPLSLWVCEHVEHARDVWRRAMAMTAEYAERFGREHGTRGRLLAMHPVLFDATRWADEEQHRTMRPPPMTIDSAGHDLANYIRARAGGSCVAAYQLYFALYKRRALRSCGKSGVNLWRFHRRKDAEPPHWSSLAALHPKAPLPAHRVAHKKRK